MTSSRPITSELAADFATMGVEVLEPAGRNRYVVRFANALPAIDGLRFELIDSESKIDPSARRALARFAAYSRLRVIVHADVSIAKALTLIREVGGTPDEPLSRLDPVHGVMAWLPGAAVDALAERDEVRLIAAAPGRMASSNAHAAAISRVDIVQTAPYGLTGDGVTVSLWDCGVADTRHAEFGGRLTTHSSRSPSFHPTWVSGTIAAAGLRSDAKGMAPRARLEQFDLGCPDGGPFAVQKHDAFQPLGIRADNNSWNFVLGWSSGSTWDFGLNDEYFGAYSIDSTSLDALVDETGVSIVFATGNENGLAGPSTAPFKHTHESGSLVFCYSENGSGFDCPSSPVCDRCEITRHPPNGPFKSIGPTASAKNVIAVGAIDGNRDIASFSNRGPTRDGRLKPELVALGVGVLSTSTGGSYTTASGTSASSPVVTGTIALLIEQWRRLHIDHPTADVIRAALVAGANDLGNPGPDFTYGYGLLDAKASVDLLRDDQGMGRRVRRGSVFQGDSVRYPVEVVSGGELRVALAWIDPEVLMSDLGGLALVNDLDLVVTDPSGREVRPWILNASVPESPAIRGVNDRDPTELVVVSDAVPGRYEVEVRGSNVTTGNQVYTLISNGIVGDPFAVCSDRTEPNGSAATAFGDLRSGRAIRGALCAQNDRDFLRFVADQGGAVEVIITATDVVLDVSLSGDAIVRRTMSVEPRSSNSFVLDLGNAGKPIDPATFHIEVRSRDGVISALGYTVRATFGSSLPTRSRAVGRR